ncbi:sulfatase [Sulfuriroseicoccus oceanibius]|uniref:Sulfatase n=1 Tax=Sulfuriroseicoccus oceanibius TaxID=2707525 RepID=A0A6B3L419_9BACT|nr:sulfatase [Sulfuriroseicoccus oceanibius]QQL45859.1 sulfatase [Sulfuriroseicoccus oceanibius]
MKVANWSRVALVIALVFGRSALCADVISVNFEQGGQSSGDELGAAVEAGVVPVAQWNNLNVGAIGVHGVALAPTAVKDRTGVETSATVAVDLASAYVGESGSGGGSPDRVMMASYVSWDPVDGVAPEDSGGVTVAGLPSDFTDSGYSVYVYFDADVNDRTFDIGVAGMSVRGADSSTFAGVFKNAASSPGDANCAVFSGLNASGFVISMNSDSGRAALNGFQIVANTYQPAPAITSFVADDYYVEPGGAVTLRWETSGATSLSIAPDAGDVLAGSSDGVGEVRVTVPDETTTYILTASSGGGAVTSRVRVGVGPARPNIVLFLVDDMGTQDTSEPFVVDEAGNDVPTAMNQLYRTPAMRSLADQGMKFTNAYAMPVCSPTRCSLMNGQNSVRHHVTNWTGRDVSPSGGGETGFNSSASHNSPRDWRRMGLDVSQSTLPALLSGAGYRTIHVGKGHFGNAFSNMDPADCGFDINIGGTQIGQPGSYYGNQNYGSGNMQVPHLEAYHGTSTFLTEALTVEMNKAIEASVRDGVPFFAYMSHYAVHQPYDEDSRFAGNYPGLSGFDRAYATLIEGMDKSLGDIMTKLNELGVAEDTLVIFLSDNGSDNPNKAASAPLRGYKGTKWEGGSRVPMIVGWAKIDAGNPFQAELSIPVDRYEDDIVTVFDLYPTVLGVAGVGRGDQVVDGYDLREYFKGVPGQHRPQELLIHFPHDHASDYYTFLRQGDYKLIYHYVDDRYELYHLGDDLGETVNLAAAEPERVVRMARRMAQMLNEHGAQWPTFDRSPDDVDDPFAMPLVVGVDLDADGLDDREEDANGNGLVDPGETNPDLDNSDGDNVGDGDEVKLGTDPLDASSRFEVVPALMSDGTLELVWPSRPGTTFTIRSSFDLKDWSTVVAAAVPASEGRVTRFNLGRMDGAQAFFRTELE